MSKVKTGKTSLWRQVCLICTAHDDDHAGTALILNEWNKNMAHWQNDIDREETTVLGHSGTLSTINPTRTPQELIPGLCGEKPVTDCLIYSTVSIGIKDGRTDHYIYF